MDREQTLMRFEKLEDDLLNHIETTGQQSAENSSALLRMVDTILKHLVVNNLVNRQELANDVYKLIEKHGKHWPTYRLILKDYLVTIEDTPPAKPESESP